MSELLISALILTAAVPAAGLIMGLLRKVIYHIVSLISPDFAFILINYLTFPGVIHHELSHALLGLLTGARVRNVHLFKPDGNSLGGVEIGYRGPWLLRCIQGCFSAAAPVVCGAVTAFLLISYAIPSLSGFVLIVIYYLLFSVAVHMTMSIPDLICYAKGTPGVFIISFLICMFTGFSVL